MANYYSPRTAINWFFFSMFLLFSTDALAVLGISNIQCICSGGYGSIDLTVEPDPDMYSGGPFVFDWEDPEGNIISNEEDLINIEAPGVYTVTVHNAYGCSIELSANVMACGFPELTSSITNVACICPDNYGAIEMEVSGGSGTYAILWEGPNGFISSEQSLTIFEAGTYSVTVIDTESGCETTETTTVSECYFELSNFIVVVNDACGGSGTGSISVQIPSGEGLAPYSFMLTKAPASNFPPVQSSDGSFLAGNLPAGEYCLTVQSANGCEIEEECGFIINEFEPPVVTYAVTPPSTPSSNDGAIDLTLTGGTSEISFAWSNGETTEDIGSLSPGNYAVAVSYGSMACQLDLIVIQVKDCLSLESTDIEAVVSAPSNPQMDNGAIDVTVSLEGYNLGFTWSSQSFPQFSAATEDIDNLLPGIYCLELQIGGCSFSLPGECWEVCDLRVEVVEQGNNCNGVGLVAQASQNHGTLSYEWNTGSADPMIFADYGQEYCITVTDTYTNGSSCESEVCVTPVFPPIETSTVITNATFGNPDGIIKLIVQGGIPSYSYSWSNDPNLNSDTNTGLVPGFYHVTIIDNCGNELVLENIEVQCEFGSADVSAVINPVDCNVEALGFIDLSLSSNIGQPTFLWSNGATTEDIYSLVAGTYSVTITDGTTGCFSAGMEYEVLATGAAYKTGLEPDPGCPNGPLNALTAVTNGGIQPFSYAWEGYPQETTATLSEIPDGWYYVTVTDAIGCSGIAGKHVSQIAPALAIALDPEAPCHPETVDVTATISGATPPYDYEWSTCSNWACTPFSSDQPTVTDLSGGNYQISITGSEVCTASSFFSFRPKSVDADIDFFYPCEGGDPGYIHVTPKGGDAPYSFTWSDGGVQAIRNNLEEGCYSLTITDINGCQKEVNDICLQSSWFDLGSGQKVDPCIGQENGMLYISAHGAYPPFQFSWSNGESGESSIFNLGPGEYCATITNSLGCSAVKCNKLIENPIVVVESITHPSPNASDGAIDLTSIGNDTFWEYSWSNGESTQDVSGLPVGSYSVVITDYNLFTGTCTNTLNFELEGCDFPSGNWVPIQVEIDEITNPSGPNTSDGALSLEVLGNNGLPLFYTWEGPDGFISTAQNIDELDEGLYCVTVTNGCSSDNLCQIIDYCGDNYTVMEYDYPGEANCLLEGEIVTINVFTDLGWGWISEDEDFPGATSREWKVDRPVPAGPNILEPESPYQHRAWYSFSYADVESIGTSWYFVTVTDAAGCTSVAGEILTLGTEQPSGWAYGEFSTFNQSDELAYWAFQEFINNSPQYANMILSQPIKGCATEISCYPWPAGEDSDGLTCFAAGPLTPNPVTYGNCTCHSMPYYINVRCEEFPPEIIYSQDAELIADYPVYIGNCKVKWYCLYYEPSLANHPFIFTGVEDVPECEPETFVTFYDETPVKDLVDCSFSYCFDGWEAAGTGDCYIKIECSEDESLTYWATIPDGGIEIWELALLVPPGLLFQLVTENACGEDGFCTCTELKDSSPVDPSCGPVADPLIKDGSRGQTTIGSNIGSWGKGGSYNYFGKPNLMLDAYPNPFSDELNIEISTKKPGLSTVSVFNILGEVIWTGEKSLRAGANKFKWIPESELPTGIYHIKVVDQDGNSVVSKVVLAPDR